MIKHMLRDEQFESKMGNKITVFSCETDKGKRVIHTLIKLGEDCDVWFFPCHACLAQIKVKMYEPLIIKSLNKYVEE
jgi:hypothetical protein